MKKTITSILLFATIAAIAAGNVYAQQLAFPGAEGFGRFAQGARAGEVQEVYHVTTLEDSGPGSLRDAVSRPNRIVVFDVAGVINIKSRLVFSNNLTVAGQTAPGEGITVYGNGVSFSGANNIIVRYMRFRMGVGGDSGKDAAGIANGTNMIFDHVSVSWGRDENFSVSWDKKGTEPGNITIQNSIIGQGLQTHSCGGLIQTNGGVTLFRNLYIDNNTRNPKVKGLNQYVNNVVYNWGVGGCYILGDTEGHSWGAIENNYFIKGPEKSTNVFTRATATFQVYQKGNKIDENLDGILNGRDASEEDYRRSEDVTVTFVSSYDDFHNSPQRHPDILSATTAEEAYEWIRQNAGASLPVRDEVDNYMINELISLGAKGVLINGESELGLANNVGVLFKGNKYLDTDNDGIPDFWEDANGLDKNNAEDALLTADNGYLNIENYINGINAPIPYVKYPSHVQVSAVSKESISLRWVNNAEESTAIILEMSADNETFIPVLLTRDVTTYTFDDLTSNTPYYFRFKTINGEVESLYTDILEIKTNGEAAPPVASVNPIPENGTTTSSYSSVTLFWENYTGNWGGELTYNLYIGNSPDDLDLIQSGMIETKYIMDVKSNTTYYWRVDAKNDLGETLGSIWSFTSGVKPKRTKVAYYSFNQAEGNNLENEYGPNAIARNFSPVWISGIIENAVEFPGETGTGFVQEHYDDITLGNESFTIEFWFKSAGGEVDWYLLHKGSHAKDSYEGATGKWFGVQYNKIGKNDRFTWGIDDDKTKSDLNISSASKYFNDEWVHAVCIRDVENKKLFVYLNGELAGSKNDNTGDIGNIENMAIGNSNSNYENAFKGLMDDLSIYLGALSAEEVQDNYVEGSTTRIAKTINDREALRVYPMPFTEEFDVLLDIEYNGIAKVSISDMTGQVMHTNNMIVKNSIVNVSGLSSLKKGYYICTIEYDNGITSAVKIIK